MKKLISVMMCVLIAAMLGSCGTEQLDSTPAMQQTVPTTSTVAPPTQPDPIPLTYDEIMRLPWGGVRPDFGEPDPDVDCYIRSVDDLTALVVDGEISAAYVKAECINVRYYLEWEVDKWDAGPGTGKTVCTLEIVDIAGSFGDFNHEIGDIIEIEYGGYIFPATQEDLWDFFLSQSAAESGTNPQELELAPGFYELVPVQGGEYKRMWMNGLVPMCEGESYTFLLEGIDTFIQGNDLFLVALYVYPADADSLMLINDYYDLEYQLYNREIAKEIFEMFD